MENAYSYHRELSL